MATFSNNSGAKTSKKNNDCFYCAICDYKCSKKFNFVRHQTTSKHLNLINDNNPQELSNGKEKKNKLCCNNCGKEYLDRSGLWRHKKKCSSPSNHIDTNQTQELKEMLQYFMKENSEFKSMVLEIVKNGTHNNNNHTNSHNKTFNLQFFLNETCKNAMNITDFVDSIKLQLSDLEKVGDLGFVNGISNIIVSNLKELDVTERPLHCTDPKRETLYIKDEGKWEKENEERNTIKKVIKKVANQNINMLQDFKTEHPDCTTSDSKFSDKYNQIYLETFKLYDTDKQDKIITNIAKECIITK